MDRAITGSMSQGGVWRRAWALMIDAVTVYVALALAAVVLFQVMDGAVRIAEVPFGEHAVCTSVATEVRRDANVETRTINTCQRALLGFVHDLYVEVSETKQTGAVTTTRSVRTPVHADGRVAQPFYLDHVLGLVLMVYLLVAEWRFGTTLGKRIAGVSVRAQDGRALSFANAGKRLVRFLPAVPLVCAGVLAMTIDPAGELAQSSVYWVGMLSLYGLSAVLWVAVLANFVMAVGNGDLPWHDRLAGTEVVMRAASRRVGMDALMPTAKL